MALSEKAINVLETLTTAYNESIALCNEELAKESHDGFGVVWLNTTLSVAIGEDNQPFVNGGSKLQLFPINQARYLARVVSNLRGEYPVVTEAKDFYKLRLQESIDGLAFVNENYK